MEGQGQPEGQATSFSIVIWNHPSGCVVGTGSDDTYDYNQSTIKICINQTCVCCFKELYMWMWDGGGGCRSMTRHGPIVMYFSGLNTQMHHSWENLGILSPWDSVPWDIVLHGFLSLWGVVPLGFCHPWFLSHLDFVPLGFCPPGILSSWVFVFLGFCPLGYCPMGFCPLGFCPRTDLTTTAYSSGLGCFCSYNWL